MNTHTHIRMFIQDGGRLTVWDLHNWQAMKMTVMMTWWWSYPRHSWWRRRRCYGFPGGCHGYSQVTWSEALIHRSEMNCQPGQRGKKNIWWACERGRERQRARGRYGRDGLSAFTRMSKPRTDTDCVSFLSLMLSVNAWCYSNECLCCWAEVCVTFHLYLCRFEVEIGCLHHLEKTGLGKQSGK